MDAKIYEPVDEADQTPRRGRPRKKGRLIGSAKQLLEEKTTDQLQWTTVEFENFYGKGPMKVKLATGTGVWYSNARPVVPIRWVLIKPEEAAATALLSTDLSLGAQEIVRYYMARWQQEVTFEQVREHLGVETGRHWSQRAVERYTPYLMGLFSVVMLMADALEKAHPGSLIVRRPAWWSAKPAVTFSDALAAVRRHIWNNCMSLPGKDIEKIRPSIFEHLLGLVCRAH